MNKFDPNYLYNTSFSWINGVSDVIVTQLSKITLVKLQEYFCSHDFPAASTFHMQFTGEDKNTIMNVFMCANTKHVYSCTAHHE